MIGDEVTPTIVVYSREQAIAALKSAADCGVLVIVASPAGAGPAIGPAIFREMIVQASGRVPQARFVPCLDCGEEAGAALAAIDAGIARIRIRVREEVYRRLAAIAAQRGCVVDNQVPRGPVLDLADSDDPRSMCLDWLRTGHFGAQEGPKAELPSHQGSCM